MHQLTLTSEQVTALQGVHGPVEVRDPDGQVWGYLSPVWSDADIQRAKKILASGGRWYTTKEVLEHLESLEPK